MWKTRVFRFRSVAGMARARERFAQWVQVHEGRVEWRELFVNNAYAVEYRKLRGC